MHHLIDYSTIACRKERDRRALEDLRDWVGKKAYDTFIMLARFHGPKAVAVGFMVGGIEGYPFDAFCRVYCLEEYRKWLQTGNTPAMTDDEGFVIEPHMTAQ